MKIGLEYFAFDVDFFENDKIDFLGARYGLSGESIAIRLLCRIYRGKGYYCPWGPDEALLFAKRAGSDPAFVESVVDELVRRGFFDRGAYETHRVLTSPEIQRRYIDATCKRNRVALRADLLLADPGSRPNVVVTDASGEIIEKKDAGNIQSKAEQSKVNPSASADGEESCGDTRTGSDTSVANRRETEPGRKKEEKGCAEKEERIPGDRFLQTLTAESPRRDAVCRRFGISSEELEREAARFCAKLASDGCGSKPRADLVRHFNNWLNLERMRVASRPTARGVQSQQVIAKFRRP